MGLTDKFYLIYMIVQQYRNIEMAFYTPKEMTPIERKNFYKWYNYRKQVKQIRYNKKMDKLQKKKFIEDFKKAYKCKPLMLLSEKKLDSKYTFQWHKKIKSVPVQKKIKIPKIKIHKIKQEYTPVWEFAAYLQHRAAFGFAPFKKDEEAKMPILKNLKEQAFDLSILAGLDFMFNSEVLRWCSNATMEEFFETVSEIKPVNLMNWIMMALSSRKFSTIVTCIIGLTELYGVLWKIDEKQWMIYVLLLAYCSKFIVEKYWCTELNKLTEQSFIPTEEQSSIRDFMKDVLGIELETLPECVGPILAGVIAIVAVITGGAFTDWSKLSVSKIIKRIKEVMSTITSIQKATEAIPKLFVSMMSIVAGIFGYEYVTEEENEVKEFKQGLLNFKQEVQLLSDKMIHEPTMLLRDPNQIKKCSEIMESLDAQYAKLIKQKYNTASVKPIFDDLRKNVTTLHTWAAGRLATTTCKIEPTILQFTGVPGIGKSRLVQHIVKLLTQKLGRPLTTWTRNPSEKYWSTYSGQDIVIYDEFNQEKEDEDHKDIMKVKNPNKCSVQMAAVEQKGMQFTSQFVIMCSNNLDIQSSSVIKLPEAINRRRDLLIAVSDPRLDDFKATHKCLPGSWVNPDDPNDIGNPTIVVDIDGVPSQIPYFCPNFSHLVFHEVPPLASCRGNDAPKEVNVDEIVNKMLAENLKYTKHFEASIINPNLLQPSVESDRISVISESGASTVSIASTASARRAGVNVTFQNFMDGLNGHLNKQKITPPPHTQRVVDEIAQLNNVNDFFYGIEEDEEPKYAMHEYSAASTAQSFIKTVAAKGKVIALCGPPGTGKSRAFDFVEATLGNKVARIHSNDLATYNPTTAALIIDDISLTKVGFDLASALAAAVYDGNSDIKVLYINFNINVAKTHCADPEYWKLFSRRLTPFQFSFSTYKQYGIVNKSYTAADVENEKESYAKMVTIRDVKENKIIDVSALNEKMLDVNLQADVISRYVCRHVPFINPQSVSCDFVIVTNDELYTFLEKMYNSPTKAAAEVLAGENSKLLKGSPMKAFNIAKQFTGISGDRPEFPETLGQFIVMVNNANFRSEQEFVVAIRGCDHIAYFMPKKNQPKVIRAFLSDTHIVFGVDENKVEYAESDDGKIIMHPDTVTEYKEIQDFVLHHNAAIAEVTERVETQVVTDVGFLNLFKNCPLVEKFMKISSYLLRLFLAGVSISEISKHHTKFATMDTMLGSFIAAEREGTFKYDPKLVPQRDYFGNPLPCEARRNPKINSFIYDDFKSDIMRYGNETAKQTKLHKLFVDAHEHFGSLDYSHDDFLDFCSSYGEESIHREDHPSKKVKITSYAPLKKELEEFLKESRDTSVQPVNLPQLVSLIDPLLAAESKERSTVQKKSNERKTILDKVLGFGEDLMEALDPNAMCDSMKKKIEKFVGPLPNEHVFMEEAYIDQNSRDMTNLVSSNTVEIWQGQGENGTRIVYGLMARDRIGATVAHFFDKSQDYYVRFSLNSKIHEHKIRFVKISPTSDLAIFYIDDNTCPNFSNIVKHFPHRGTNVNTAIQDQSGILCTVARDQSPEKVLLLRNIKYEVVSQTHSEKMGVEKTGIGYQGIITNVRTSGLIQTKDGDCGSALILCNPVSTCKIVGMHNAADTHNGFGSILFQEYFTQSKVYNEHSLAPPTPTKFSHTPVNLREHETEALCGMPVVGSGTERLELPTKTHLWTSPTRLPGPSIYEPAILSAYDTRNSERVHPFYKSVEKWSSPQPVVDLCLLDQAIEDIAEWYSQTCYQNNQKCKILSKTTAINAGIEFGLQQLNRQSSPGYGWSQYHGKKQNFLIHRTSGNREFWAINKEIDAGTQLDIAVDALVNKCRNSTNIKPIVIFAGHLKDEPLKLSKIVEIETRSFAGAPFEYVIAMRQYFGAAVGAVHNCRHLLPSKIGINPTSIEWHNMFTRMLEVSDLGFDADYKNFDATVLKTAMLRLPQIWNRIFQLCDPNWCEEDDKIRQNLHNALYEPYLAIPLNRDVHIVRAAGGQVSGQPLTADDNCLLNLINLYMHWLTVFKDTGKDNITWFNYYTNAIIYGDDVCVSVHPDVIDKFNCETFVNFCKGLNLTVTDAAKTGTMKPFIRATEFEFLKRKFVQKGLFWVGPLSENSISKALGYTLGKAHHWDKEPKAISYSPLVLKGTMDSVMQEAVIHGKVFYNNLKEHLMRVSKDLDLQWTSQTYNGMVRFKQLPLPMD